MCDRWWRRTCCPLFSKALIHGFKLISPLKINHFLVSDWSLAIKVFVATSELPFGFQVFSWWQQRKTRQWTATPATTPLGGNKAARAEATRVNKDLVEARTSPTPKTDRRVNQTVASWRMASAAQGLQATPPTGDILASKQSPKQTTLFSQKAPLSKYLSAANGFKPQLRRRSYASRWTPQPNTSTSASTTRMSSRCQNVYVQCQEKTVWTNVYVRRFLFLFLFFQTVRTKRKRRESEDSTEEQQQQQVSPWSWSRLVDLAFSQTWPLILLLVLAQR